jgi:hypothetical protein
MLTQKEQIFNELKFDEKETWKLFSKYPFLITKSINSYITKTKYLTNNFNIINFRD